MKKFDVPVFVFSVLPVVLSELMYFNADTRELELV